MVKTQQKKYNIITHRWAKCYRLPQRLKSFFAYIYRVSCCSSPFSCKKITVCLLDTIMCLFSYFHPEKGKKKCVIEVFFQHNE